MAVIKAACARRGSLSYRWLQCCTQHLFSLLALLHLHFNRHDKSCGVNAEPRVLFFSLLAESVLAEGGCINIHVSVEYTNITLYRLVRYSAQMGVPKTGCLR